MFHWRGINLAVPGAVVFLLRPSLGGQIQGIQVQAFFSFEHGHQATFNAAPEGLLLGVLIR